MGVDASYMHGNFGAKASGTMSRQITVDDINYAATANSAASINFTDVLTLRGRAGYVIGNFLPMLSAASHWAWRTAFGRAPSEARGNISAAARQLFSLMT
jgi:hypothetical protein